MKIAQKANASVLLVTDIDKGGSFASLVGTMALIEKKYQKLVKGFVFNKFRGDLDVLKPGFQKLKNITKSRFCQRKILLCSLCMYVFLKPVTLPKGDTQTCTKQELLCYSFCCFWAYRFCGSLSIGVCSFKRR